MPNVCALLNCPNRSVNVLREKKVSMHRFPQAEARRSLWAKWVSMINQQEFAPGKYSVLCSDHFERKFYTDIGTLMNCAVPTLWFGENRSIQEEVLNFNVTPDSSHVLVTTKLVCKCPCFCGLRTVDNPVVGTSQNSGTPLDCPRTPPTPTWDMCPPNKIQRNGSNSLDCEDKSLQNLEPSVEQSTSQPNVMQGNEGTPTAAKGSSHKACRGYMADILSSPRNFSDPRRRAANCEKVRQHLRSKNNQIKNLQRTVRRWIAKAKTLRGLVDHLIYDRNVLSEEAATEIKVRLLQLI